MSGVYNVPSSCSLVDILAKHLLGKYSDDLFKLTETTVFLPNRRAVRELRAAFVRLNGLNATLLPKIMPLGTIDEDEMFFGGNRLNLPEVINSTERLMIFIRLITARPDNLDFGRTSFAQSAFLAKELASLVDMVKNENLNFADLNKLVPDEYASHWQNTLQFLKIITEFYPQILKERNRVDIGEYNQIIMKEQNCEWLKNPPQNEIIIAGTTATFPAMKELVKTVSELPQGSLWLSGVDKYLDDKSWDMIDETHPQFELKQLLEFLQISRHQIVDITAPLLPEREKLLSEVMRPADSTDLWRNLKDSDFNQNSLQNIHLINCHDSREEALTIATIMRNNLETPEKTTALITEDRNLARRVSNELLRWNIKADDSAGLPLSQTPLGIFLRLISAVCQEDFAPLLLLSLYKHPFSCFGKTAFEIRSQIREYEKYVLRSRKTQKISDNGFLDKQKSFFAPLYNLMSQPEADFKQLLTEHIKIAEAIAERNNQKGAEILWSGEAGETAANLLSNLLEYSATVGKIPNHQYHDFFEALLAGTLVRSQYGSHPRLRILGPIESRLCSFDSIIIAGLNEGSMPMSDSSGIWLSRPMKKEFGYPLPEKAIGVLAHDFCNMAGGKEVFFTRAERVDGTPMVKSRWLMRMETVINAAGINSDEFYSSPYLQWSKTLDKNTEIIPISAPCPKPPLTARPRELWASDIEKLILDPYSIFASKILKLKKIEDISPDPDAIDIGVITHAILENFYTLYPQKIPDDAEKILKNMADKALAENDIATEITAFWQPKLYKFFEWVVKNEKEYRPDIAHSYCEVKGRYTFKSSGGDFTIGAKADRLDICKDGTINIIDYKTGEARSVTAVEIGYAPQLPIEGIIAQNGGFENTPQAKVNSLAYWKLGNKIVNISKNIDDILNHNMDCIKDLIEAFDNPNIGYITRPFIKYKTQYSDYNHLSRIDEWEVNDNND